MHNKTIIMWHLNHILVLSSIVNRSVKLQSPNFNFKLDIRCDEIESGKFQYERKDNTEVEAEVEGV